MRGNVKEFLDYLQKSYFVFLSFPKDKFHIILQTLLSYPNIDGITYKLKPRSSIPYTLISSHTHQTLTNSIDFCFQV